MPARAHMSKALAEYFSSVTSSDAYDYGFGAVRDFVTEPYAPSSCDWVITNPPFRSAEQFVKTGLSVARVGVAILARTVFLESVGRYSGIFRDRPPTVVAQFTERVPMVKGRLDRKASTATGYAWLVWEKDSSAAVTRLTWIPPSRKKLERDEDYSSALLSSAARWSGGLLPASN